MNLVDTNLKTIATLMTLIGVAKINFILVLSLIMIFLDFSMAFLIGIVLSKLMGVDNSLGENISSHFFSSIEIETILPLSLGFVLLRTVLGLFINKVLYTVIYQAYHKILWNYWLKSTASFSAINSLVQKKNIQKVFSIDASIVIGGLLIPTIQITIEISVLLLLLFFIFHQVISVYAILATLVLLATLMVPIKYFVSKNKIIGNEKNILEENRTNFLSKFEKVALDLFMFDRIVDLGEKLRRLNMAVSGKIAQHAVYTHGGRIVVEGLVYTVFFAAFIVVVVIDKERLSSLDWGLVSALLLRILPIVSRAIQSAQSISYSLSPALSFIKSWETTNLIEYGGVVRKTAKHIKIIDLNVKSNSTVLLSRDEVDFSFGSITAVTGPSGSGKSTLLDAVFHILRENKIDVSYLRQDFNLLAENIEEEFGFDKLSAHQIDQVKDILQQLGLDNFLGSSVSPMSLSGGQRQRLALARTILFGPKILLLDEFSSALDEITEADSFNVLAKLKETGFTIVLSTHNQNIAKMCDYEMKV